MGEMVVFGQKFRSRPKPARDLVENRAAQVARDFLRQHRGNQSLLASDFTTIRLQLAFDKL
jgi:hypothetical protein